MPVEAFGYAAGDWAGPEHPTKLSEVTFVAAPAALRRIARHLLEAADALEVGDRFDHSHLQDVWEAWSDDDVDVIVAAP